MITAESRKVAVDDSRGEREWKDGQILTNSYQVRQAFIGNKYSINFYRLTALGTLN